MTKDELEQEAEYYSYDVPIYQIKQQLEKIQKAYVAGAEPREKRIEELEKKNAELRKIAEFQQFSNMGRHFENKKLKDTLAVGSTWNKHLNAQNKALEEERDKYRNMVFDKDEQLTEAKEIIKGFLDAQSGLDMINAQRKAEQFLKEISE